MGDMLSEIMSVGLQAIELGYTITEKQIEDLFPLVKDMDIHVVSVHNFCPLPPCGAQRRFYCDYYRISSLDEQERSYAVEFTKRTIDIACRFSAPIVILHAGMVELKSGYGKKLFRLYRDGMCKQKEFHKTKEELLAARERHKASFYESTIKSLDEILAYAQKMNIKIGLENRYYPAEIPSLEEAQNLLQLFGEKGLVYWHDIGHAEVSERMEIHLHKTYFETLSKHLAGFHIHDFIGIRDHIAPFSGECDFSKILPFMKRDVPFVIEAHQGATPVQIKESVNRLSELLS